MISYHVRSRYLIDVINDVKAQKLILSPYFQRNLVWREGHKVDFIKTILLGFPFPEIFVARGTIDVEKMTSTSCVVDGQQRMNSIQEYIDGNFPVDGIRFGELTPKEKENFLKYEIAIIDLDLAVDDAKIIEIFKRLNRTFYALSNIEKTATEFASAEFMLVAKLLAGELEDESSNGRMNVDPELHSSDPNVTKGFVEWANSQKIKSFVDFILQSPIFSKYEISRKVHLMFTLNLMSTALAGYYNRNDKVKEYLDEYSQDFENKGEICARMNSAAAFFMKLKAKPAGFWSTKSTSFSIILVIDELRDRLATMDLQALHRRLEAFAVSPPPEYSLAAKEGVNNKKERLTRYEALRDVFLDAKVVKPVQAPGAPALPPENKKP